MGTAVTVPIYLGDSLQLRYQSRDMFASKNVTIGVRDEVNTELLFPISLVNHAESFDQLMVDVAEYLESGQDPKLALQDVVGLSGWRVGDAVGDDGEASGVAPMQGRDHIWAYYTRNLVRPINAGAEQG